MKKLIPGLFSSVSDAELFMATMGEDAQAEEGSAGEGEQASVISRSDQSSQQQNK